MQQHYDHSRNRPTATDEKREKSSPFGCDFSGWYNFPKIIKIFATRCHILKLKCTKFAGGAYNAIAGFQRPTSNGVSVAEGLACWTQAPKGLGSNRSRDAVG